MIDEYYEDCQIKLVHPEYYSLIDYDSYEYPDSGLIFLLSFLAVEIIVIAVLIAVRA
jgi:hypothetical protein